MDVIKSIIEKKFENNLLYAYYKYVDRFKDKPVSFDDLFDYMDFISVDNGIQSYHRGIAAMQKGSNGG